MKKHSVLRRDGRETVLNSGWDAHSQNLFRIGGGLPTGIANRIWARRYRFPRIYSAFRRLDKAIGAAHDFIDDRPLQSVKNFLSSKSRYKGLGELHDQVKNCDCIVINGEGTMILGNPLSRDAKYLLFLMALGKHEGKPVHLLNAMVTPCPYSGLSLRFEEDIKPVLSSCEQIAAREDVTLRFVKERLPNARTHFIPDALFTWGQRIRNAGVAMSENPGMSVHFQSQLSHNELDFSGDYICVSSSSSAWRDRETAVSLEHLIKDVKGLGMRVYLIQTCSGDSAMDYLARQTGTTLLPFEIPVLAAAGILSNARVYITGRYHPAIMAAAGGVPTIFMASNSHKTRSVQELLGYVEPFEFPVAPTGDDKREICKTAEKYLNERISMNKQIRENFDLQAERARAFADCLD